VERPVRTVMSVALSMFLHLEYGVWTKLTANQPRGKNLSYDNNNTAIAKTKKKKDSIR